MRRSKWSQLDSHHNWKTHIIMKPTTAPLKTLNINPTPTLTLHPKQRSKDKKYFVSHFMKYIANPPRWPHSFPLSHPKNTLSKKNVNTNISTLLIFLLIPKNRWCLLFTRNDYWVPAVMLSPSGQTNVTYINVCCWTSSTGYILPQTAAIHN